MAIIVFSSVSSEYVGRKSGRNFDHRQLRRTKIFIIY